MLSFATETAPSDRPFKFIDKTPAELDNPVPPIADTKSTIDSFFELLSSASIKAILSAPTATAASDSPFKEIDKTPAELDNPVPPIADTKSTIDSFFELLSSASIKVILSAPTATAASDSPFKEIDNCPDSADNPVPAIPDTKSTIDSFFVALESLASIKAILSAPTATAPLDSSFKLIDNCPDDAVNPVPVIYEAKLDIVTVFDASYPV